MLIYSYSVFGQQASKQQIAMLNELSNKFDYVTDDFYPENNRYVPKGISVLGIEWKAFYPVINKDGTIYFVAFYRGRGWLFVDKIAVKINDEILEFIPKNECIRETDQQDITEKCYLYPDNPIEVLKKIAEAPKSIVRYSGRTSYSQNDVNTDIWRDCYLFYQLMDKMGKFKKE